MSINQHNYEDKEIERIFNQLNQDPNTHTLTQQEVIDGLSKLKIPKDTSKKIFNQIDRNKNNKISLKELTLYIRLQEDNLKILFSKIDINQDGFITDKELKVSLRDYYPNKQFSDNSVKFLFKKMDFNNDGEVDFHEWREFLLFLPEFDLEYLMDWGGETSALLFNIQDTPLQMINERQEGGESTLKKWLSNFLAGGVAGAVSRTLTAPLDRLQILYQVRTSNPPGIFSGLKEIVKKDGLRALFRGNFVNVCKATPETSIRFAVFEMLKQTMRKSDEQTLKSYQLFLAGAGSGLASGFMVFPLDVLKTRFAAAPNGAYDGVIDAIKKISKAEGRVKPFFNGFQATLFSALPSSGINLMTYEFFKLQAINYYAQQNKEIPLSLFMTLGAFSAVIASSLMYPFGLVKSRIIMQGMSGERLGMIGIVRKIIINEGYGGFYKGFKPAMSKILLGNAISYGAYESCKKYFEVSQKQ